MQRFAAQQVLLGLVPLLGLDINNGPVVIAAPVLVVACQEQLTIF